MEKTEVNILESITFDDSNVLSEILSSHLNDCGDCTGGDIIEYNDPKNNSDCGDCGGDCGGY